MLESIAKECEDEGKRLEKIERFLLFEKVKRTSWCNSKYRWEFIMSCSLLETDAMMTVCYNLLLTGSTTLASHNPLPFSTTWTLFCSSKGFIEEDELSSMLTLVPAYRLSQCHSLLSCLRCFCFSFLMAAMPLISFQFYFSNMRVNTFT